EINSDNKIFKNKCKDNFENVLQYLRNISEKKLYKIFDDGIIFAESIINNREFIEKLKSNDILTNLVFEKNELSLLMELYNNGKENSSYVNIEYWSILIYFYFIIEQVNFDGYKLPEENLFVKVVQLGNINKNNTIPYLDKKDRLVEKVYYNGFNTYYRILFSITIFSNGKCTDLSKLSNINNLNIDKIRNFLIEFDFILTLNYDWILEMLLPNYIYNILHLHGRYILDKKEFVNYQSIGFNSNKEYVSCSDLLIGDYFYNKIQRGIINILSSKSDSNKNKKIYGYNKILEEVVKNKKINTFVIFGMSIDNDQHILRTIMASFYFAKINNPQILYCYFSDKEKEVFNDNFYKIITFDEELSNYSKNIRLKYVKTNEILNNIFY
ncbi:TPA: hypothetical protein KR403_001100, partial [Clostridioides difficile]|nr:hypothetical protein [Clostridioides difficile]